MRLSQVMACTVGVASLTTNVFAHDLSGIAHESALRSSRIEEAIDPKNTGLSTDTRSVISKLALWKPGSTIIACFYEGSADVRSKIKSLADQWTSIPNVNLKIDFGGTPNFRSCSGQAGTYGRYDDIRIGFRSSGFWSYVGLESHRPDLGATPSMNLQDFDNDDPRRTDKDYLVLHEFGHAVGLEHEHQAPGGSCEAEFDLVTIQKELKWSDELMKRAFHTLEANARKFEWSPYDPLSVMMYSLPTRYFKQGIQPRCQVPLNKTFSNEDRRAMQRMYPMNVSAAQNQKRSADADSILAIGGLDQVIKERASLSKALAQ